MASNKSLTKSPTTAYVKQQSNPTTLTERMQQSQATAAAATTTTTTTTKRLYRAGENKWVTRDIASLEFLLGIPLNAEREIVQNGWQLQFQKVMADYDDSEQQSSEYTGTDTAPTTENEPGDSGSLLRKPIGTHSLLTATAKGTWWEKWVEEIPDQAQFLRHISAGRKTDSDARAEALERPTRAEIFFNTNHHHHHHHHHTAAKPTGANPFLPMHAPGRRLEGDEAIRIQIPLTTDTTITTNQRSIARQAALREWELQTAHGIVSTAAVVGTTTATNSTGTKHPQNKQPQQHPPLLDGRLFFSANSSYPVSVFSMIRYEPKKEEAAIRRRKLENAGGGGSQFILPVRDWRGISYRALLRPKKGSDANADHQKILFNKFVSVRESSNKDLEYQSNGDHDKDDEDDDDSSSVTSTSSDDSSDFYVPGLLDDPGMVLGRHRTVTIGDRVTGPIVSSTIQFVRPALLKAELNKQFRERFDGWEPPKSQRKYIGAKVIGGNYVLVDPTAEEQAFDETTSRAAEANNNATTTTTLRMPPSLTLSKIRSLKNQALQAAVKAGGLEIGTVALACVYFERLCLDCRVDKSNRRLSFAACLLLASKLNEPSIRLVTLRGGEDDDVQQSDNEGRRSNSEPPSISSSTIHSMIRPNKRSKKIFASLLLFFTQEWELSLKHLFNAEWGVFAALRFKLDAPPSHVAFHFKRLMKTLEWNIRDYLGVEMYNQWQQALADEEERKAKRERRKEVRRQRKEERLLNLHIEIENEVLRRKAERKSSQGSESDENAKRRKSDTALMIKSDTELMPSSSSKDKKGPTSVLERRRIKLFDRFALRRSASHERLMEERNHHQLATTEHREQGRRNSGSGIKMSPSMPSIATTYPDYELLAIDIRDNVNSSIERGDEELNEEDPMIV
jgi:hypothetical protein